MEIRYTDEWELIPGVQLSLVKGIRRDLYPSLRLNLGECFERRRLLLIEVHIANGPDKFIHPAFDPATAHQRKNGLGNGRLEHNATQGHARLSYHAATPTIRWPTSQQWTSPVIGERPAMRIDHGRQRAAAKRITSQRVIPDGLQTEATTEIVDTDN
jgi:hypothetical protein